MSTYTLSRITDVNGDNWDIKAKALESQVNIALTGNVTGSTTTDLSGNVSIASTIANGAVTTAKIADGNVTTAKLADGNVTLDKIASSARSGAVSDNDGKLATHAQVKYAIDLAVAGGSVYRGQQTVATINTWLAANLNNGDRVIASDSGTITLGNLPVVAGQECVFYKAGSGESQVAVWQSTAGTYKLKQTPVSDPQALGESITFISGITQNENGEINALKRTVADANTTSSGLMTAAMVTKLNGIATGADNVTSSTTNGYIQINGTNTKVYSHPTTTAASAAAVKVGKDSSGHVVLGSALGISDISGLQSALDGKQASGSYKTTQTAVVDPTAEGEAVAYIDTIAQNTNGVITATKKTIPTATVGTAGITTLSSTSSSTAENVAATPKGVWAAINTLDVNDSAVSNQFVTKVSEADGKISVSRATPTISNISGLQTALNGKQATLTFDTTPTASSTNPVTSGGIKTYVDNKAYVNATNLTSSNNLNSYPGSASTPVMWYKWSSSSVPTNAPSASSTSLMEVRFFVNSSGNYCMQTVYTAGGEVYMRKCTAGSWDASWTRHFLDATSTYSSTGTQAVNGAAVASAINALDSTKTSTNGTNVQVQVAETDGKISSVSITTDNTENRNNKITAWNTTASATAYPAESLVVSALAGKKNVQTAKTDPTASGNGITYISTITQNTNGEITATKSTVRPGTTTQTGVVQLSDTSSSTDSSKAATPKGVWNAINTLDVTDTAQSNQFVTAVSETNGKISVSRATPTIANVSGLQTALNGKEGTFTISYNSEDHALVFSKAFT